MNFKFRLKSLCAVVVAAAAAQTSVGAFAENVNWFDDNQLISTHMVFGTPSQYGEIDSYMVDEFGNTVEEQLIPDAEDRVDAALPSSYDLRKYNRVTSVKSQGSTGTCWAHSAIAAAESSIITDGLANTSLDLSEAHLVWFSQGQNTSSSDPLYNDINAEGLEAYVPGGGSIYYSRGAFASWMGADYEANYPNVTKQPQIAESNRYNSQYHLQKSVMFDPSDRSSIKSYLMENGALTISYYHDDSYVKLASTYTSYYQSKYTGTNHAVAIVGWDDNFSKNNFVSTAPGDGAWIIKNNWGSWFGDDGYFYLSYYDTSINRIASLEFEKNTNYDKVYQYDAFANGSVGYSGIGISAANIFTSDSASPLTAVSFYTEKASTNYAIRIYSGVSANNPSSGTLMTTQTGKATYAGYHTIDLTKEVSVPVGTKFSVVVSFTGASDRFNYDTNSNSAGQSFFTSGTPTSSSTWNDLYSYNRKNFCIKAFTKYSAPVTKPAITAAKAGDSKVKLQWNAVTGAEMYRVYYYLNGKYTRVFTTDASRTIATVSELQPGTKYGFVVSAKVNGSWTDYSNKADLYYATPTGVVKPSIIAYKVGNNKVKLEWRAVSGAEMYRVYYYLNGKYTRAFTANGDRNVATVTNLSGGSKYGFVVSAKVNGAWTDYSSAADLVYATPTGSPKPFIVGYKTGNGKVKLEWQAVSGAEMYRVYYYLNGKYTRAFTTDGTRTIATVTRLKNGTNYAFVVSAKANGSWTDFTNAADFVYATPNA